MAATIKWKPISRDRYWEMLEVLPPAVMGGGGFMVGEPWDHDPATGKPRFAGFRKAGEGKATRYYEASKPMTIAEFRQFVPGAADYAYSEGDTI